MYNTVTPEEFYQKVQTESLTILDVREQEEYQAGHIKQAIFFPLSKLGENYASLNKVNTYYLVCRSGNRSGMASQFLAQQGYQVVNVLGGMNQWPGSVE